MALNKAVNSKYFSGHSKVYSADVDGLAAIIGGLLRERATVLLGDVVTDLTNSGAGGATFTTTFADDEINLAAHGLSVGDVVCFTTSGADLPAPLVENQIYYVSVVVDAGQFKIAATLGGTTITITDDGTGTHTLYRYKLGTAATEEDLEGLTTGCTAASVETSKDTVIDAQTELADQLNLQLALIGGGDIGSGAGAASDGTIGAIDVDVAANTGDADATSYASWRAIDGEITTAFYQLAATVNALRVAVGLDPITLPDSDARVRILSGDLGTTTTTAANHADPPVAAVLEADVEALLAVWAEAVTVINAASMDVDNIADATTMSHFAG